MCVGSIETTFDLNSYGLLLSRNNFVKIKDNFVDQTLIRDIHFSLIYIRVSLSYKSLLIENGVLNSHLKDCLL